MLCFTHDTEGWATRSTYRGRAPHWVHEDWAAHLACRDWRGQRLLRNFFYMMIDKFAPIIYLNSLYFRVLFFRVWLQLRGFLRTSHLYSLFLLISGLLSVGTLREHRDHIDRWITLKISCSLFSTCVCTWFG